MNTLEGININSHDYALRLDKEDPIAGYRSLFHMPKQKNGNEHIYLTGNSLGLMPKMVRSYVEQELKDWEMLGVEGHFHAKHPWMPYHEFLTEAMAKVVGAKKEEVVVMNTLTTNLHLMMVSFYQPNSDRYKILIEGDAFPSDKYAVESQIRFHGYDPQEGLIIVPPRMGEDCVRTEDMIAAIEKDGDQIALVMIGGVNYYTGQVHDMKSITEAAHKKSCMVGFDLAHGAGNLHMNLHDIGMDFAAWCSYKYLNSGPGSLGGVFVHERHATNSNLPRFEGWWGHDKETRFKMRDEFKAIPGAEGWQLSNPPILPMASMRASLDIFNQVGMEKLNAKSTKLVNYMEDLINGISGDKIEIITPSNPEERGCQISIKVEDADKTLFEKITNEGVIADWREPDVIRVAAVPLYNSFEDVFQFVNILKKHV